jgi:hypothetical protein
MLTNAQLNIYNNKRGEAAAAAAGFSGGTQRTCHSDHF